MGYSDLPSNHDKMRVTSKVQIATRVDKELLSEIIEVQNDMQADRAKVIRRLLDEGTRQYKLKKAMELLRDGKVTVSRSAEFADISIWDIMETMGIRKISIPYSAEDLRKSLELAG